MPRGQRPQFVDSVSDVGSVYNIDVQLEILSGRNLADSTCPMEQPNRPAGYRTSRSRTVSAGVPEPVSKLYTV